MQNRLMRASAAALAAASLAIGALVPASMTAAAAPKVVFRVWLDDGCFAGKGPASSRLTFTLRKPSGALVDTKVQRTTGTGAFDTCFEDGEVRSGYTLRARKGTNTLRTITVPGLTVTSNRVADTIGVRGPRGERLSLAVYDCNSEPDSCPQVLSRSVTLSATGRYATDISSVHDALGHDIIEASFRTGAGDAIVRVARFPFIVASLDSEVYGSANPGSTVKIRLKDGPGGTVLSTLSKTPGSDGRFGGSLALTAGRELSADFASDARITIPAASVTHDDADNTLSGICLPNQDVIALWYTDTLERVSTTADPGGSWSVDLDAVSMPAPPAETLLMVTCTTPAGDQLYHEGITPP